MCKIKNLEKSEKIFKIWKIGKKVVKAGNFTKIGNSGHSASKGKFY
jgi:hypothetical protein